MDGWRGSCDMDVISSPENATAKQKTKGERIAFAKLIEQGQPKEHAKKIEIDRDGGDVRRGRSWGQGVERVEGDRLEKSLRWRGVGKPLANSWRKCRSAERGATEAATWGASGGPRLRCEASSAR